MKANRQEIRSLIKENNLEKLISVLFFTVVTTEVTAELFSYTSMVFVFKPLISIVLNDALLEHLQSKNTSFFLYNIVFLDHQRVFYLCHGDNVVSGINCLFHTSIADDLLHN